MRGLPVLLLVAACKSAAPAPTPAPTAPPTPTPLAEAPAFAGLFRAGGSWSFKVERERTHWDDSDPDADSSGNVTRTDTWDLRCKVTATVTFPGGRASEIECDEDADRRVTERIAGVWIQTADGLWHGDSLPDEGVAPTLDPEDRFLPAHPEPRQEETRDPPSDNGPAFGSGTTLEIEGSDGNWCVFNSWFGGDESWTKLCLDADGPASGGSGFAGAETDDFTFERIDQPAAP